jgi:hypothetical protein
MRHPHQPRLLVAEAQPPVKALAAGVHRPVLRHHRQVAPAGRGQANALVAKQLRPSRARAQRVQWVERRRMSVRTASIPAVSMRAMAACGGEFSVAVTKES